MKLLIVDDHTLFRSGLVHLLRGFEQTLDTTESDHLAQALHVLKTNDDFDLVLLDLDLGDTCGVDGLIALRDEFPNLPTVVLSGEDDPEIIQRCIDLGAMGFVTKTATHEELLRAIELIVKGGVYLPRDFMTGSLPMRLPHERSGVALIASLSDRQREVLTYLLQGKPNKTISDKMHISQNTVKAHLSAIYRTLGARNRTEAVYFAARAGVPLK